MNSADGNKQESETTSEQAAGVLPIALADRGIQRLYANGFTIGMSNADSHIVLQLFGRPVAVVSMSYTLMKTLHLRLGDLVKTWEAETGQTLQTTDTIEAAIRKNRKGGV